MDKAELRQALRDLDDYLQAPCEIVIVGGAAMILRYSAARATRDVDVLLLKGSNAELRYAARQVATEHDLPDDWLNDAVKSFADILPPDFQSRLQPLETLRHIKLYTLGLAEQTAMKIIAMRDQDLEDLELLLPQLQIEDKAEIQRILTHLATKRLDWAQRMRYFLLEQGWELD